MISKKRTLSTKQLLDSPTKEVARLRAENTGLRREVQQAREEKQQLVEGLMAETARLQAESAGLWQEIHALREEAQRLQQEVERLQKLVDANGATKPPAFVKANTPVKEHQARRKRAPEHNHGRRRMTPMRYVPHPIEACPSCGDKLSAGGCDARKG